MRHSNVWRTVFYFLLMTHLCGDLGHTGHQGEIIHKLCTTPSTLWMIVFHFPPLTYKGLQGETGKNVHSISQTPPHETLKCVKDCFLFPPYDPLVWWHRPHRSSRWDHSQAMYNTLNSVNDRFSLSSIDIRTKDQKVKKVRMSTVFPKHLHMKHSNVWRTVFYFFLMTHLCGDIGDRGPPGETIHKAMHNTLTLWIIGFHFPPWTYKGDKGEIGKNVHSISQTPPHETLKCVKDCFLFLPYDPLVWWPRRNRSTRWDHSQAMHNTLTLWMIVFHFPPLTYKGPQGVPGKNVHSISQTSPHETLKCVKDCFLFTPYDPLVWWPRPHRSFRWDHSQAMHNTLNSVTDCFSLSSMDIQRTKRWNR